MLMHKSEIEFNDILNCLVDTYDWFERITPKGSITNCELFYVYEYLKTVQNPTVFESGIGSGRSTIILSEILDRIGGRLYVSVYQIEPDIKDIDYLLDRNINIKYGKAEIVIKDINGIDVSIIDGPKPAGYMWGNPGWDKLLKESTNRVNVMFQHDINNKHNMNIFNNLKYDKFIIPKQFLQTYPIFGCHEKWKETEQNLGVIILNDSIDISYFTSRPEGCTNDQSGST